MKKILVTGASGGIGGGIAEEFAKNGYFVGLGYNSNPEGAETVADKTGGRLLKFDVSEFSEVKKAVELFAKEYGGIDAVVNCAGVSLPIKPLIDTTEEEYERAFSVNVKGVYNVCKCALPYLTEKRGCIVNISSMWGISGASCEVLYSASKAAVIGFTKSLAKEYAEAGVRVNAVAPGFIDTKMNDCIKGGDRKAALEEIPLGRFGVPDDVAKAVYFLVEKAQFMTGEILNLSGGEII